MHVCEHFRQILSDIFNEMFESTTSILNWHSTHNNVDFGFGYISLVSMECSDALALSISFSSFGFDVLVDGLTLLLCQFHSHSGVGNVMLLTSIAQLFGCIQSFKESISVDAAAACIRIGLNSVHENHKRSSLILSVGAEKPFEVE